MRNVLMVVSGPSGVGKGTLVKALTKKRSDLVESVSCTTRAPRENEIHGREYYFISKDEFIKRVADGDFLEYDEHFGNFYGTPKSFVKEQLQEKSVVLEIDVIGGLNAKKAFPECVLIMIAPPSIEKLKQRLVSRNTESTEEIENRMSRLEFELSKKDEYDYVVVNDDLSVALEDLEKIFENEKNK
ncbi:MAG: guanylate kinase [Clostridiales bacterium]|nr:guanylate kinase [Clostridiales bacterium]